MSGRRTLIAGNWKMNCLADDATALAGGLAAKLNAAGDVNFEMLVCPSAILIPVVATAIAGSSMQLGGQDNHANAKGAHTGDTSTAQLKDAGCTYAIVGHSERRTDHAETDAVVNAKAAAAQGEGLTAVICIGETEAERDAGKTLDVNGSQIAGSVPEGSTAANTVNASEPVWAIRSEERGEGRGGVTSQRVSCDDKTEITT